MRNTRRLLAALLMGIFIMGCSDTTGPRLPKPDEGEEDPDEPSEAMLSEAPPAGLLV